jgi:hypothetical protein
MMDDETVLRRELERLTPDLGRPWRTGLQAAVDREARRRGIAARPTHLRLRVLGLVASGTSLLALALALV